MIPESTRQLIANMRYRLEHFQAGPSGDSLDDLVSYLSEAIDGFSAQVNEDWIEELQSAWWALEYVNAMVLADERITLTETERADVAAARDEFLLLLQEY